MRGPVVSSSYPRVFIGDVRYPQIGTNVTGNSIDRGCIMRDPKFGTNVTGNSILSEGRTLPQIWGACYR